jgi:SAM-dependent methyltransferase
MLPLATSVTHTHLTYALAAELAGRQGRPVRILDAGCGSGHLLLALHRYLPGLLGQSVHLAGFDVSDARVQKSDFFGSAQQTLLEAAPDVNWPEALSLIRTDSPWPYEADSFDAVVTNQVLEHVADLGFFLRELERVLRPGGISVNLFPIRPVVLEGHVGAPLAHRIHSDDVRRAYLRTFARLGLARMGPMRRVPAQSADDYGETRAEYIATQTAYRSFRELALEAHRAGLTVSYRWTPQFYLTKLGYVFGRDVSSQYRRSRFSTLVDFLSFGVLSRVSSVTVVFSNHRAYDPDDATAGHLA